MKHRTLLLDGDITAYQFALKAERPIDWGEGHWTLHADASQTIARMEDYLARLREDLEADEIKIVLSDKVNFRKGILPSYKQNRKDVRRPVCLAAMRQHMLDEWDAWVRPALEGDDVLGILATSTQIIQGEKVVVSVDKDMRTIPGPLINLKKAAVLKADKAITSTIEAIEVISEEDADRYHLEQTLTGDTTDGYAGCPGVGPAKAKALLDDPHTLVEKETKTGKTQWAKGEPCSAWEAIVCQFQKAGFGAEEALTQARVARILRASDYNFKRKEPRLWLPKS